MRGSDLVAFLINDPSSAKPGRDSTVVQQAVRPVADTLPVQMNKEGTSK
jgi:hypothetical protein